MWSKDLLRSIVGRMDLLLSHISALEVLRRWNLSKRLAQGERCAAAVPPGVGELPSSGGAETLLRGLARPIHVLVSEKNGIVRRQDVRAHLQSDSLPEGSAILVADGLLCSSPELLAVQMAPQLTWLGLVCLLSELVGLYAISPGSKDGMFQREEPLTSPERLWEYLGRLGPRSGARMVGKALAHVCMRSGSPRETKLTLRLALRPGRGGCGLNILSMNEPVTVRRIHDRMSEGVRKPDILIASPDGSKVVAMEYLGSRHNEPKRLVEDATRTNELKAMGIGEYQIRKEHYDNLAYMDGLVEKIREELGYPRLRLSRQESERRRKLREELHDELELLNDYYVRERPRREEPLSIEESNAEQARELVPVAAYGLA